jgi:phosphate transport system permease protein
MVAFIGSNPTSVLMPASAIPVQIYLWSSSPDYILINKASALILMLITFLLASNIVINIIRKRFEIKW